MDGIFLPTLHTFAMNNIFTGSLGPFRFRIVPKVVMLNQKEVNMEESSLEAEFWHGPYCYEKSQMEGSHSFPMSEEGRQALKDWLESQAWQTNLPPGRANGFARLCGRLIAFTETLMRHPGNR